MTRKIVLSLARATSQLHLGNYLGAARDFVALGADPGMECYFGVADLHALTSLRDAKALRASVRAVLRDFLCIGIDPSRSALFLQSRIPETSELFWLLCNVMSAGELQRSKTFKEMAEKQPDNVNAGLLTYPVLMAADILGPGADLVPVGEDQIAHLEMARNIAQRFNHVYGETFRMPEPYRRKSLRIPGLDGKGKMSKSTGNGFGILESPEEIWKKLAPAYTDPARKRRTDPGNPDLCPIGQIHGHVSPPEDVAKIRDGCTTASIGCVDCKKILHGHVSELFAPARARHASLMDREIDEAVESGVKRAAARIGETVARAKERVGL